MEPVDHHPEILGRFKDFSEMGDLTDLGHQLISTVIPQATWDHGATAIFMPLRPYSFYASKSFCETLLDANARILGEPDSDSRIFARNLLGRAYLLFLQKIYGIQQEFDHVWHRGICDPKTGLTQHFRLKTNQQFVNVESIGTPPDLSEAEQRYILEHLNDPEVVQTILPLNGFRFNGFVIET